jgi:O-antigen ligase
MSNLAAAAGVFLLAAFAPFEMTRPILQLPGQAVTNLEALLVLAVGTWLIALANTRRLTDWRSPLARAWLVFVAASALAAAVAPGDRVNAWHMTGRLAAAAAVYGLTVDGITNRTRLQLALRIVVLSGIVVAAIAVLEYREVESVLRALRVFRQSVSGVGAQVRAGGTLQYPTIASMYLEVVFAFGLGLMLMAVDSLCIPKAIAWALALVLIAYGITLTFTRAGLITMAASLSIVAAVRIRQRGLEAGGKLLAVLSVAVMVLVATTRSAQSLWLRLTTEGQDRWYRARIEAPRHLDLVADRSQYVPLEVTNTGLASWDSRADPPMLLSYHWLDDEGSRVVAFEGERTEFGETVEPGETITVRAFVRAPRRAGAFQLEWDVVQEGVLWFSTEQGAPPSVVSRVLVAGAASGAPDVTRSRPPRSVRPGRLVLWTAALRMAAAHPVLGVGPDNFRLSYGAYSGLRDADTRTHSNNMYLEVLAGGGVLAAIAFLWLLWRAGRTLVGIAGLGPLPLGVAAAGAAIAIHGLVDSFLSFAPTYILFAMTLGFAAAISRVKEPAIDAHRV